MAYISFDDYLEQEQTKKQPDGEYAKKPNWRAKDSSKGYMSFNDYLEQEKWDRAYNEERSRVVRLNQQTFNARALDAYNQWRAQRSAQPVAPESDVPSDVYIPAQFGQRILDNQRQQEYAQRMYNTYIPATLAQDALNRSGRGNDFNAFSDRVLRYDYLNNADTAKMKAELDALNAELKDRNKYYSGATRSDSIVRRVQGDDSELAQSNKRTKEEYEALKARAEQLEKNLRDAEMLQRVSGYEAARNSADFAEKSKASGSKRVAFSFVDPSTWAAGDDKYDFINDIDGYRKTVRGASAATGQDTEYGKYSALARISDNEISMYNYLYATKGKEAADEYIDYIAENLNYRQGAEEARIVGDSLLKASGYGFKAGVERFGTGITDLFRDEATATPIREYGTQLVRENLADTGFKLPEFMGGSSLGQVGFDLANTAGNMTPSYLLSTLSGSGGAGSALMGLSAAGNAKMQALRQGYSNEQATKYGLLVGASEGALQYLLGGISKLGGRFTGGIASRAIQNIDNALLKVAANSGIKMAGEGTEEYLQEILEPIYRNLIFNESNQVDLLNPDAVYSFMLGALTSGVMESPNTVRDLAGAVRTEAAKARERAATPNINGALVGSNSLVQDSGTDTVNTPTAQQTTANTSVATGQVDETTEQYAYTDPTTGIPMVGTRPAQDTQTGNAAADTARPPVETEEYAYIDKTTGIPMVGTRTNIASEVTPEAIARNKAEVAGMEPVAEMDGSEFPKGSTGLVDQVTEFFKSIGNRAVNPSIGQVTLDRRGAKSSLAHGMGRNKAIAFKAVPDVIRNGKIIDFQADWKGRGYDTVVIAAPVVIKGETFYEGAILIRENRGTSFYLHEVTALENKDTNAPIKTGSKAPSDAKVPSLISLLDEIRKVNTTRESDAGIAPNVPQTPGDAAEKTAEPLSAEQGQDTALRAGGQFDTISLEEEGAIRSYKSGMTSYAINEKLYSGMELDDADKTLVKNLDSALGKMPNYEGTTYRVLCFDRQGKDAYDAFIARHVPNALMLYGSYTSASKAPDAFDIDGNLKVRIEIEGKTGKDVSRGFGLETEQEVLYGRDVYYVTKAVETAQDGTTIIKIKEADFNDEGILSGREESVDSANQGDYTTVREVQEMDRAEREGPAGVRGLSERDTQSADYGKGRPLQGELSGRQRNSRGAEGTERSSDGALRGQEGNLEEQRAETTEHLRRLRRDVITMEVRPERIYTDAEMEALANKRITDYTADDIYMIASSLKNRKGLHLKDVSRVLDAVAGGDRSLRNVLHNLIEVGHNEALGEQGRRQSRDLEALQQRYKQRGIKAGSKESAAVMKFGERGYFDRDGTWVDYTLDDLQAEFPNKWKDIMETAQEDRAQYDAYIDEANEMLERIYPKMMEQAQAELESAREAVERNNQRAAQQRETIAAIEARIKDYNEAISKKKRTDTAAYAKLKNGIEYQERRLRNAQQELNKAEQRAEDARFKAARLDEEIKNGEPLHQRKIERRKDYYHHVRASGLTFDLATLIGSKSAASEMVAGRVAAGDAGGVIGNTIDKMIGSVMGNKDISPGMVGVSDNTSPRTRWQGIMEHQGAGAYKLDSYASMADYIGMIDYMLAFDEYTSQVRDITNTIQAAADKLDKSVGKSARDANAFIEWMKDWCDMLTGKTLPFDRGAQKVVGRNVMNGVRKLNSVVRSSTLLANIRSMIVQGSAIANAMNYIPNPADWARGMRYQANAMKGDPAYADAIAQSNFLSQRNMLTPNDIIRGSLLNEAKKPLGKMLNIGQNAVDRLTWWTAYAQYDAAAETPGGLDKLNRRFTRAYDNAIDYADDITRRSVAGRGVGEQPMTVKSTAVDTIAPFQTEVLNTFNTLKENVGAILGRNATKEQKARAAAGLVAYEIAAFAINMATQAMFGDDVVGFDFIGALMGALFDDDEEENFGEKLLNDAKATLLSGLPFASAVTPMIMDEETSKALFGADGNPSRYGTGTMGTNAAANIIKTFFGDKDATGWDKLNAAAAFFPLGGKQLARTAQGIATVAQGGSYKTNKDGEEQLQFRTDQKAGDALQAALFGKWALPEAREYVEKGFPILSAPHTAAYKNAIVNGIDGAHFLVLLDRYKALEPIKNEEGETEKSTKQQFREILFKDSSLTAEQKAIIDKDILCSDEQTPADYTSRDRFEISTTHAGGIFIPNDDPYERFTENINKGLTEAEAVLVEKWARKFSGLKSYTDSEGNEIGVKEQKRDMLLSDSTLTAEEKQLIDRSLISSNNTPADYSSDASFYVSQLSDSAQSGYKLFKASGGSQEKYMEYHKMYDELEPTKDINGEIIPGSRQEALRNNIMNDDDMTPEQKRQLDEALTGGKTRDYTSWFTFKLGKTSGSAYKRGKAYVAAGISETNALLIEQWMDGRKYTKADLRKYLSKLKLTDSEIEAVLEARY